MTRAVVVAVQLPGVTDDEQRSSVAELVRLAKTLGLDPIGQILQKRAKLAPGVVLGDGKLKELAAWTGGTGVVPAYSRPGSRADEDDGLKEPLEVFEAACRSGLEGIVSKQHGAPYSSGRGDAWTKAKCRGGHEVVIGGWTSSGEAFRSSHGC